MESHAPVRAAGLSADDDDHDDDGHTDRITGAGVTDTDIENPRNGPAPAPLPVRRALRKLGADIRDARLRRRIPTKIMAERASISRTTLNKIEKGDPGVSLGNYASVLFVLGLSDRLAELADSSTDTVGLELEEENLPQRIRRPRGSRTSRTAKTGDT